jgi:hypothetical protein
MLCNLKHVHSAKVEGNMGLGVIRAADGGKTVSANFDPPSAMAWLIGGSSSVSLGMIPPIGQRILEIQIAPAKARIVVLQGATGTPTGTYWWATRDRIECISCLIAVKGRPAKARQGLDLRVRGFGVDGARHGRLLAGINRNPDMPLSARSSLWDSSRQ